MQVRILGPFQLEEGGRRIAIGGLRQRAVLAGLVLHANEVVPSEQLLVELWGEDSPPGAAAATDNRNGVGGSLSCCCLARADRSTLASRRRQPFGQPAQRRLIE